MNPDRVDRIARVLATPASRRTAVLGAVATGLAGMGIGPLARLGVAHQTATPLASEGATPVGSPSASPGPLNLLAGTPVGASTVPQARGATCEQYMGLCAPPPPELEGRTTYWSPECCTNTCVGYRAHPDPVLRWVCA